MVLQAGWLGPSKSLECLDHNDGKGIQCWSGMEKYAFYIEAPDFDGKALWAGNDGTVTFEMPETSFKMFWHAYEVTHEGTTAYQLRMAMNPFRSFCLTVVFGGAVETLLCHDDINETQLWKIGNVLEGYSTGPLNTIRTWNDKVIGSDGEKVAVVDEDYFDGSQKFNFAKGPFSKPDLVKVEE